MLEITDIHKSFGENHVLNGLNLSLDKGKIYTLIGGNGTGKTTLFNLITGFIRPDKGKIIYKRKLLNKKDPVTINHYGITRTFQDLRIINYLTVKENILLSFKHNPGEKIFNSILPDKLFEHKYNGYSVKADEIISKIHLHEETNSLAREISYGQQKLLTMGCCIANDAELMLLDEPVAGIDSKNYEHIVDLILQFKQEGKTILQIEHNTVFIEELSDVVLFIDKGIITRFKDYNEFKNDKTVQQAY